MPLADRLCLTEIDATPEFADAYFPEVDASLWLEESREEHGVDDKHAFRYYFVDYLRRTI
jgi:dihydrofolate reductase